MASDAKAEVRGIFQNGQTAVPLRITLNELCFTQPPTPIKTDNSSAEGYHYCKKKKVQGNGYQILLDAGQGKTEGFICILETRKSKMGYYFTEHHPPHHHKNICSTYLYKENPILKLNHTVVQVWKNEVLKLNYIVVQGCVGAVRTCGHTNIPTVM